MIEFYIGAFFVCLAVALILLTLMDIIREPAIEENILELLSKYYLKETELDSFNKKCIKIATNYYKKIFPPNPIYEKIFITEVIQAFFIISISLYELKYNSIISMGLKNGISLLVENVISDLIPTIQTKYIRSCFMFREKQYMFFFEYAMNKLFLTQNDIAINQNKLFFMTLSNIKILYDKDIEYFEQNHKAIPIVNEKVFNSTSYKSININKENSIFLQMIYELYKECNNLTEYVDKLMEEEQELRYTIRKTL